MENHKIKLWFRKTEKRGVKLIECTKQHEPVITNRFSEVTEKKHCSWTRPTGNQIFQLDYRLMMQRYINQIKSSHSYPEADINSDYKFNSVLPKT